MNVVGCYVFHTHHFLRFAAHRKKKPQLHDDNSELITLLGCPNCGSTFCQLGAAKTLPLQTAAFENKRNRPWTLHKMAK